MLELCGSFLSVSPSSTPVNDAETFSASLSLLSASLSVCRATVVFVLHVSFRGSLACSRLTVNYRQSDRD